MIKYDNEAPIFEWNGAHYEGNLWALEFTGGKAGRVDGDLVLEEGSVITAQQIVAGFGPKPLTMAARRLLRYSKQWVGEYLDEDNEGYTDIDEAEECGCASCRRNRINFGQ